MESHNTVVNLSLMDSYIYNTVLQHHGYYMNSMYNTASVQHPRARHSAVETRIARKTLADPCVYFIRRTNPIIQLTGCGERQPSGVDAVSTPSYV